MTICKLVNSWALEWSFSYKTCPFNPPEITLKEEILHIFEKLIFSVLSILVYFLLHPFKMNFSSKLGKNVIAKLSFKTVTSNIKIPKCF